MSTILSGSMLIRRSIPSSVSHHSIDGTPQKVSLKQNHPDTSNIDDIMKMAKTEATRCLALKLVAVMAT